MKTYILLEHGHSVRVLYTARGKKKFLSYLKRKQLPNFQQMMKDEMKAIAFFPSNFVRLKSKHLVNGERLELRIRRLK